MRVLYPSNYGDVKTVESMYAEEMGYMLAKAGASAVTFSMEEFEAGKFRKYGVIEKDQVLYRGWMMTPNNYKRLYDDVQSCNANMITTPAQYHMCHWIPGWYYEVKDFTAKSFFIHLNDLELMPDKELIGYANTMVGGTKFFVKDFVKSAGLKSVAESSGAIRDAFRAVEKSRGFAEGGICIRAFEVYKQGSERRYFVFNGEAFSSDGIVPNVIQVCAKTIKSPFFSVDIAEREDGVLRIIEIGDGQVSDLKEWSAKDFVKIFEGINGYKG